MLHGRFRFNAGLSIRSGNSLIFLHLSNANLPVDVLQSPNQIVATQLPTPLRARYSPLLPDKRSQRIHTSSYKMQGNRSQISEEPIRISFSSIAHPHPPGKCLKISLMLPSKRLNTLRDVYCRPEHIIPIRGQRVTTPLLRFLPEEYSPVYKSILERIRSQTAQFPLGVATPVVFGDAGSGPYTVLKVKPSEQMLQVYNELRSGFAGTLNTPEFNNFSSGCRISIGIARQPQDEAEETVRQMKRDFPNGIQLGMVEGISLVHRRGLSIFKRSYFFRTGRPSDRITSSENSAPSPNKTPSKPTPFKDVPSKRVPSKPVPYQRTPPSKAASQIPAPRANSDQRSGWEKI
jgi:hypothetical protein